MIHFKKILILFFCLIIFIVNNSNVLAQNLGVETNLTLATEVLNSYVPPFYEGKPLPGEGAYLKILANIKVSTPAGTFDSSKFFYSWTVNDFYSHTYSKTGGDFLIFPLDILSNQNVINLKVYTDNKLATLLAEKTITLYPKPVKAILYRDYNNPILTYANAINKKYLNYAVSPNENFQIIAEPYYYSVDTNNDNNLDYLWSLNGIPGNIDNNQNTFAYTAPNSTRSSTGISLKLTNLKQSLQSSEQNLIFIYK